MLDAGEDELSCDLAEVYHIYDMERLPVDKVAVFACGLSEESRIKRKISGQPLRYDHMMLTGIFDLLSNILFCLCGKKHAKPPKSLLSQVLDRADKKKQDCMAFDTGESFRQAWERITGTGGDAHG